MYKGQRGGKGISGPFGVSRGVTLYKKVLASLILEQPIHFRDCYTTKLKVFNTIKIFT